MIAGTCSGGLQPGHEFLATWLLKKVIPPERLQRHGAAVCTNETNFSFARKFSDGSQRHAEMLRGNFLGQPARNREQEFVIVAAVKGKRERVEATGTEQRRNGNGR